MPTIDENKRTWDGDYNWANRGDEWSAPWGGPSMQWYGTIFPRIKSHVPTARILEIACGYGRWTEFLKDLCKNLVVVDLSEECVQACRERFSSCSHIEYHVNDGKSLDLLPDSSVDFVFSFDSLVHADESVMKAYLGQFRRILNSDGVAFIHHSNLGEYQSTYSRIRRVPGLERLLKQVGVLEKSLHGRDPGVSAAKVAALAEEHGLRCITQEIITWGKKRMLMDCLSTIVRSDSSRAGINHTMRNKNFEREVRGLFQISQLYGD